MNTVEQKDSVLRLILLGPPGSGKSTQAKMLTENMGLPRIATGDLMRFHQQKGTPFGLKTMEYMNHGLLVPDEIPIAMVLEEVLPPMGQKGFLLDGFPRNLVQAEALDEALAGRGLETNLAILIKVTNDELVKRLGGRLVCQQCQTPYHMQTRPPETEGKCDQCGGVLYQRQDDTPEAVKVRIDVYEQETRPLIEYYRGFGKMVEVDGQGAVKEVNVRILEALSHQAQRSEARPR